MLELRCSACGRLLRVPDDALGRQARCPACAAVVAVPSLEEARAQSAANQPGVSNSGTSAAAKDTPTGFDATLPYQGSAATSHSGGKAWTAARDWSEAYRAGPDDAAAAEAPPRTITPTPINIGDVFSQSWTIFLNNLGSVIGAALVVYLLQTVCGVLISVLRESASRSQGNFFGDVGVWIITYVTGTAFTVWVTAGLIQYLLRIARGEPAHFGQLFEAGSLVIPATITAVAYSLTVTIGLVACVVPGIIVGLMYWMALPLVIDTRMGVGQAFKVSQKVTAGNKLALAGVWLICMGLIVAGALLCGIGLALALPFVALFQTVTYLAMTGQPIGLPGVAYSTDPRTQGK